MIFRRESDSMGSMDVPSDRYWGCQTQRSIQNFKIGQPSQERMPAAVICSLGIVKQACAEVNVRFGVLSENIGKAIIKASAEVASGKLRGHFPLLVWQTGSGTQVLLLAKTHLALANKAITE